MRLSTSPGPGWPPVPALLSNGHEYPTLNDWCQSYEGRATLKRIEAIEKVVIDWAKERPVTRIHQVRTEPPTAS